MNKKKGGVFWKLLSFLLLAALALAGGKYWLDHRPQPFPEVETERGVFTESAKLLINPNRGFLHMHGFRIEDEEADYRPTLASRFCRDTDTSLTMIQINLKEYRDGPVSAAGMENLERLFQGLAGLDQQLILRFLYDWDGKNLETEPESREVVLTHMEQLEPLLREYGDEIFTVQGIFVGDFAEMHHSKFLSQEDIRSLAGRLAEVTAENTYLAVRTPRHWRIATGDSAPGQAGLPSRLGLFNDGMLGSGNDVGTYGEGSREQDGPYAAWQREEELAFQEDLCRLVPNGGEAVLDNSYNDLENAIRDLGRMHVTYLNREHDEEVLEKWAASTVSEEGCFDGMDGLTYIERHLGYRLVAREARLDYDQETGILSAGATVQNVGFAPVYREAQARITFYEQESGAAYSCPAPQDVRELAGGTENEQLLTLGVELSVGELSGGSWEVFLDLRDKASGQRILLGNEQEPEEFGYRLGKVSFLGDEEHGTSN